MDGQHLAHPGIVIQDKGAGIARRVEVPHPSLRTAHKASIAEDDPRLLWTAHKTVPKNLVDHRNGWFGRSLTSVTKCEQQRRSQQDREHQHGNQPASTGRLSSDSL